MLNGGVEDGQDDEEREVKEAVMAALEAKGVLSQVRATLRAAVFTAVDAQERAHGIHVPNEKALSLQNTHQGRLALDIICDFLEHFEFDQTLSVLRMESAMPNNHLVTRQGIAKSIEGSDSFAGSLDLSKPILMDLMEAGENVQTWSSRLSNQTMPSRAECHEDQGDTGALDFERCGPEEHQEELLQDQTERPNDPLTMTGVFNPADLTLSVDNLASSEGDEIGSQKADEQAEGSLESDASQLRQVEEKIRQMEAEDPHLAPDVARNVESYESDEYGDEDFDDHEEFVSHTEDDYQRMEEQEEEEGSMTKKMDAMKIHTPDGAIELDVSVEDKPVRDATNSLGDIYPFTYQVTRNNSK